MDDDLTKLVEDQAERKLRARRALPWRDFATFGIVGWSVALPTVMGLALGIWVDQRWPSQYSWTLIFLALGVMVGCFNAWRWVKENSL